ncbi:MAG: BMC domain-containing protein [Lachnospiraceae bacterium]|nr:BMC domain-containing protein [Lachnospiraceae bacterium]
MYEELIQTVANAEESNQTARMIQEYVPGKQITLAHIVTRPMEKVYKKLGLADEYHEAIGILTITPSEASIIAADICSKSANIELGFVDRFSGSVIIVGTISHVDSALKSVLTAFRNKLHFEVCEVTKS